MAGTRDGGGYMRRSGPGSLVVLCGGVLLGVVPCGAPLAAQEVKAGGQVTFGDDADFGIGPRVQMSLPWIAPGIRVAGSFDYFFPDSGLGDPGGDYPADGGDLGRTADQIAACDAGLLRILFVRHGFLLFAWHQGLVAVPGGLAVVVGGTVMFADARARRRSRRRRRWIIGGQRCSS